MINRSIQRFRIDRLYTDTSLKAGEDRTKCGYFCKKKHDLVINSNARWIAGRRIKKDSNWEIIKEDIDAKKYEIFPRIHRKIITLLHLIENDKYLVSAARDGLVVVFNFDNLQEVYRISVNLDQVVSMAVFGNAAVFGGCRDFGFVDFKKMQFVDYKAPNEGKFKKFFKSLRQNKDKAKEENNILKFECDSVRTLQFALNANNEVVVLFGGTNTNCFSKVMLSGPFSFLEPLVNENKKRSSSVFSKVSFLKKPSDRNVKDGPSRNVSITSIFSFNQTEAELKKVRFFIEIMSVLCIYMYVYV